ncbi:DNA polymerase III subunit gamma/tau [Microbacterium sp. BG28]|uniref:DNA polymerase III subunit gamma/tau n=1 Tax=Microbacterium sp. BG28 TaxID=3097356 RepID=UPI002A5ADD1A|nr:DNA polymerase III subunit gamma/tau [Microbacterium sp. BG28]MDY0828945.1 DNA polymerase III subunit gamma/tau [Microbacterium sp. BG28]
MVSRDDDALSWDGDDDPTLAPQVAPRRAASAPQERADVTPATRLDAETEAVPASASTDAEAAPMSNVALVTLGVFGGIYLLLAVGWFIGGSRLQFVAQLFINPAAHIAAWILAIVAPAVWFATTMVLTRSRPMWLRIVALVVGAVVLLPWPFLMTGVGA